MCPELAKGQLQFGEWCLRAAAELYSEQKKAEFIQQYRVDHFAFISESQDQGDAVLRSTFSSNENRLEGGRSRKGLLTISSFLGLEGYVKVVIPNRKIFEPPIRFRLFKMSF